MSNQFGATPKGWASQQLDSLCDGRDAIVDGPFGSNLKRSDYRSHGIPVLKIQNVKPNQIELKKMDFVAEEKFAGLSRHSFQRNDILMTKLGDPLGVSAVVKDIERGLIVADLVRIRPQKINTYFLCYQLNSPRMSEAINLAQKGTTRPRINLGIVRNLPIVFPSADEQKRIVDVLDEQFSRLDAALASVRTVRDKAKSFRRSLLQTIFVGGSGVSASEAWEQCELRSVAELTLGVMLDKKKETGLHQVAYLANINVRWGSIDTSKLKMMQVLPGQAARALVHSGDLVVCEGGEPGRSAVWKRDDDIAIQKALHRVRPSGRLNSDFLSYYFEFRFRGSQSNELFTGTTIRHLPKEKLATLRIPLPSIEEQLDVVAALDTQLSGVDAVLSIADQLEVHIASQRRSLLHAAFSGTLTAELRKTHSV
jgi:type I restriction enzyme S subunit